MGAYQSKYVSNLRLIGRVWNSAIIWQLFRCHSCQAVTIFYFIKLLGFYISKWVPNFSTLSPYLDTFPDRGVAGRSGRECKIVLSSGWVLLSLAIVLTQTSWNLPGFVWAWQYILPKTTTSLSEFGLKLEHRVYLFSFIIFKQVHVVSIELCDQKEKLIFFCLLPNSGPSPAEQGWVSSIFTCVCASVCVYGVTLSKWAPRQPGELRFGTGISLRE